MKYMMLLVYEGCMGQLCNYDFDCIAVCGADVLVKGEVAAMDTYVHSELYPYTKCTRDVSKY